MLVRLLKIFGITLIIFFSAISIFFALQREEIGHREKESFLLSYPSFFEDRFYDIRASLTRNPNQKDERLVMAAIDDESLHKIGRFPWSRDVWAKVVDRLGEYKAKVIMFDVFFFEEEKSCTLTESPDDNLSQAIKRFQSSGERKIILPYQTTAYKDEGFKEIPDSLFNFVMNTKLDQGQQLKPRYVNRSNFVIKTLTQTGAMLGHVQTDPDADGIMRHNMLLTNIDSLYFPSISLLTYMAYTGDPPVFEMTPYSTHLKLKTGGLGVDLQGGAKIRWFGTQQNFAFLSLWRLLNSKKNDPELLKILEGKIIFVGSNAFGAHDLRHSPVDPILPGVYAHINSVKNMLDGDLFVPKEKSTLLSWALLIILTLLIISIQFFGNAVLDFFSVITISIGLFLFDTYYLTPKGYEIKLFFCLFSVIATYSWNTFLNFYLSTVERKKIKGTFSRYVSPAIVDQMLADPTKLKIGGEKKNITAFFSDVRDFTTISEKLSPEELSRALNYYMGKMTDIIFENEGTIDKYIGDAIVAFWGAPLSVPLHPDKAVKAALEMIEVLPEINEKFRKEGLPEFRHGIGLNTGECSVGNMGSDQIFAYTALGDAMNLGARVESLCKFYGVELNISENTINALSQEFKKDFHYRTLDKVRVKGKNHPVTLYEGLHKTHYLKNNLSDLARYEEGFILYQNSQFRESLEIMLDLLKKYPQDKAMERILKNSKEFLINPPPSNWDGVFTHTTKG